MLCCRSDADEQDKAGMKLVLASANKGKLIEMRELLEPMGFDVISKDEAGVSDSAEETGLTFLENAELKAAFVCERTGLPSIADDSGLCVDALSGAPGVFSARWADTDSARIERLLKEMDGVPDEKRTARFTSAIVCVFPNGQRVSAEASCEGTITHSPHGNGGFGYDPVFRHTGLGKTFAETTDEEKNAVSHRGLAMAKFCEELKKTRLVKGLE